MISWVFYFLLNMPRENENVLSEFLNLKSFSVVQTCFYPALDGLDHNFQATVHFYLISAVDKPEKAGTKTGAAGSGSKYVKLSCPFYSLVGCSPQNNYGA